MKQPKGSRLLALLLTLAMVCGLLTVPAFATGNPTNLTDLQNAINSVAANDTVIQLGGNISGTVEIKSGNNYSFTIDLNGKTLTGASSANTIVKNGTGTLTITDSSNPSAGKIKNTTNSDSTIVINAGTVNVENGTVESTDASYAAIYVSGGTLTVSGGKVTSVCTGDNIGTIYNSGSGTVNVSGGEVENTAAGGTALFVSVGTATVSGGSIYATGANGTAINNAGSGTVTVTGGSIYATGEGGVGTTGNVTNGNGSDVIPYTLMLTGQNNKDVTDIQFLEQGGTLTPYGTKADGTSTVSTTTKTDDNGKLYAWLPNGATYLAVKAKVNGSYYTAWITAGATPAATLSSSAGYTVSSALTNLTSTPASITLTDGGVTTTLTPAAGYKLPDTISVTMMNDPLDSGAYYKYTQSTGKVEIPVVIGTVVITATGVPDSGGTTVPVTGVTLNQTALSLYSNTSQNSGTLTATVAPATATNKTVTWSSSAPAVATVDTNGVVTAVSNGTTTITATAGGVSATCTVTVSSYSTGGGGDDSSSSTVTPPSTSQSATQAEVKVAASVDSNGKATVSLTEQAVTEAINQTVAAAKKAGRTDSVTLVLTVTAGGKTVKSLDMKLPRAVLDKIGSQNVASTVVVVDGLGAQVGLNLAAVKEISRQAGADVRFTVTPTDSSKLTGAAKALVGTRPAFDYAVHYGTDKTVTDFGSGSVTLTTAYTLQSGETAAGVCLVYVDETGAATVVPGSSYDAAKKAVTGSTGHFSTFAVGYDESAAWGNPFADVAADAWYFDGVRYAVQGGLFAGTTATTFAPQRNMTRAMLWTVLARLDGQDVSGGATYYAKAQVWAKEQGISDGTNPNGTITRQQLAALLYRYDGSAAVTSDLSAFSDGATVSNYAKDAMVWAVESGILSGNDGKLLPHQPATRAQVAMMLYRLAQSAQ